MTQVITTNGGAHPPHKWAQATANMIVDPSSLSGERYLAAEKLKICVAEVLEAHHALNIERERHALEADPSRIDGEFDLSQVEPAVTDLLKLFATSPWAEHFNKSDVQDVMREIVGKHFASSQLVVRQWHQSS